MAALINKRFIPVSLDADENRNLARQWGVRSLPTQLMLKPDGQVFGSIEKYVDAPVYMAAIENTLIAVGAVTSDATAVASQTSPKTESPTRPCDSSVPLGLEGYCPVTMITRAELVPGAESHCLVHKDKRYLFYSDADKSRFLANPDRYLPAENGLCVVSWVDQHKRRQGHIKYPALFGDHLFLFPDDSSRQKFLRDPEHYVDNDGHALQNAASRETPRR